MNKILFLSIIVILSSCEVNPHASDVLMMDIVQ